MNHTIKNLLGAALIILCLVAAGATVAYIQSYTQNIVSTRTFWVSGEGEVVAIPDIATFSFGVVTEGGEDIAALQSENAEAMNAALSFVKGKGVKAEDITTQRFNIEPRYKNQYCYESPCPVPEIVGYKVTQTVKAKIRDFTVIGEIMTGLTGVGVNSLSELSFTIDDPTSLQAEARGKAITQAQEKAEAIAKAGGFTLGRLVMLQESTQYSRGLGGGVAMEAVSTVPVIEPGTQEVVVQVTLSFEIR